MKEIKTMKELRLYIESCKHDMKNDIKETIVLVAHTQNKNGKTVDIFFDKLNVVESTPVHLKMIELVDKFKVKNED